MVITTTAVAFSLSALGLAFVGLWFFKAFQKIGGLRSGSRIGILLSVHFLILAFQHLLLGLGGLFFIVNSEALYALLVVDNLVLAIVTSLGVYLLFYTLVPKYSPWFATISILIYGIFVTIVIFVTHPQPFMDAGKGINWNMPQLTKTLLYYLLLFNIGAPFLIFTKNFFTSGSRDVKTVSFIIMLATFLGLINISMGFTNFLNVSEDLRVHIFSRLLGTIGILFVIGFLIIPVARGWLSKKKGINEIENLA